MSPRSLQVVLRSLADAEPPTSDTELLRRFLQGDSEAFTELVRRHGRLVWAACRHLTGSDAEADDAFQATFLVLLRNGGKIRDAGRLSAWLYGVAHKVCARARRSAKRRTTRERATAVSERSGSAVADSAWDRALTAVHEEVARLPETLRVPFVLCCLEGKGVTEAAEQLGWKLGTFSGRLTRAKDALLARLNARGLTLGAVAGLGLAAPPAGAIASAAALAQVGFAVPASVLQLTKGVIGMSLTSFKVLVLVMVTCGLGLGVGAKWMATADAQSPGQPPGQPPLPKPDAISEAERKRLAELECALKLAALQAADAKAAQDRDLVAALEALAAAAEKNKADQGSAKTTKWEYDFVAVSDMDQAKFVKFLQDREGRGWDFTGATPLTLNGKPAPVWVFRRPVGGGAAAKYSDDYRKSVLEYYKKADLSPKADEVKAIEAEIAKLQERLAALKAKPTLERVTFAKNELPLPPKELGALLEKLAAKKFVQGRCSISATDNGITIEGDKEAVEWAVALIKKLSEK